MANDDDFDTTLLLGAVDALDQARSTLYGGQGSPPPEVRDDLLRLHQLAMEVYNEDRDARRGEMFELASDLLSIVETMLNELTDVESVLSKLMEGSSEEDVDGED